MGPVPAGQTQLPADTSRLYIISAHTVPTRLASSSCGPKKDASALSQGIPILHHHHRPRPRRRLLQACTISSSAATALLAHIHPSIHPSIPTRPIPRGLGGPSPGQPAVPALRQWQRPVAPRGAVPVTLAAPPFQHGAGDQPSAAHGSPRRPWLCPSSSHHQPASHSGSGDMGAIRTQHRPHWRQPIGCRLRISPGHGDGSSGQELVPSLALPTTGVSSLAPVDDRPSCKRTGAVLHGDPPQTKRRQSICHRGPVAHPSIQGPSFRFSVLASTGVLQKLISQEGPFREFHDGRYSALQSILRAGPADQRSAVGP